MFYCNSCSKYYTTKGNFVAHLKKNSHIIKKIKMNIYYLLQLIDEICDDVIIVNEIKSKTSINVFSNTAKIISDRETINKAYNNFKNKKETFDSIFGKYKNDIKLKKLFDSLDCSTNLLINNIIILNN